MGEFCCERVGLDAKPIIPTRHDAWRASRGHGMHPTLVWTPSKPQLAANANGRLHVLVGRRLPVPGSGRLGGEPYPEDDERARGDALVMLRRLWGCDQLATNVECVGRGAPKHRQPHGLCTRPAN